MSQNAGSSSAQVQLGSSAPQLGAGPAATLLMDVATRVEKAMSNIKNLRPSDFTLTNWMMNCGVWQ